MEEKNVIISICGDQEFDDTGLDRTEFVTEGLLRATGDGYDLLYDESELTGMEGTRTTFQVRPRFISLIREGEINSQMIFEQGRKHYSLYETPYGTMTIDISTSKMKSALTEHGGDIEIQYAIEIEHQVTGESRFRIQVREAGLPQ